VARASKRVTACSWILADVGKRAYGAREAELGNLARIASIGVVRLKRLEPWAFDLDWSLGGSQQGQDSEPFTEAPEPRKPTDMAPERQAATVAIMVESGSWPGLAVWRSNFLRLTNLSASQIAGAITALNDDTLLFQNDSLIFHLEA